MGACLEGLLKTFELQDAHWRDGQRPCFGSKVQQCEAVSAHTLKQACNPPPRPLLVEDPHPAAEVADNHIRVPLPIRATRASVSACMCMWGMCVCVSRSDGKGGLISPRKRYDR